MCQFLLTNYSLLIGANNCGKTNIIDALRVFYEKDNYKFNVDRDVPKFNTSDSEVGSKLWFTLTRTGVRFLEGRLQAGQQSP